MTDVRRSRSMILAAFIMVLTLAACGASGSGDGETGSPTSDGRPGAAGTESTGPLSSLKIATIFSGKVTDADFTQLGLLGLQAVEDQGATVTYAESVPVPDVEKVIRDYVADGNTVIWTHGSQFYDATVKVAADNPDVHFIAETEGQPTGLPDNVWTFDWQFHLGFYAMGVLAAKLSHTGKIGYVGGLSLPFSNAEVHAMKQAIADLDATAHVDPVWTGDFNDPAKARQISTRLIDDGADVIVGSLNNGAVGMFQAAEAANGTVWVTAKYTDKSSLDTGGHYAGTVLYDFTRPLEDVLSRILGGEGSGYYAVNFSTGVTISMPDTIPADIRDAVTDTMHQVDDGSITVVRDTSKAGG